MSDELIYSWIKPRLSNKTSGYRAIIIEQYPLTIYERGLFLLIEDIIDNPFGS